MPNFAHILSSDRCKTYWTGFTLWPQEHPCYIWCNIIIFDVTLLYLDEDGYKQYPSTTYQQKSYWQVNYSKFHKNIPFFKPGCLKLCCVVQGQFLPEAWGFAMACHRLPNLAFFCFSEELLYYITNLSTTAIYLQKQVSYVPQCVYCKVVALYLQTSLMYSRTSMAWTSLGPWKFFRDMSSLSHWRLIMAPVQEANSDNLGKSFYTMIVCWVYSLESNEYKQHTIPW